MELTKLMMDIIKSYGYLGSFAICLINNLFSFIPFPDMLLIAIISAPGFKLNPLILAFSGAIGITLSKIIIYWAGFIGSRRMLSGTARFNHRNL